jgi:hypothetical protein
MANLLIYHPQGFLGLTPLGELPAVEVVDHQSLIGKKIQLLNEIWLRDQIVWLDGMAYETLNNRAQHQYAVTSLLHERGITVLTDRYLPFQGGHLIQGKDQLFCATSCAIDHKSRQHAFDRGQRLKWGLEDLEQFKRGHSSEFIRKHLPGVIPLPSLRELPWSYHADLTIAFLGNLALVSDPSLFSQCAFSSQIKEGLQAIEHILQTAGFETLRFPLYFDAATNVFHAPLNGLTIDGCFYYSLIEGMTAFNEFVKDFVRANLSLAAVPVIFPPSFLGLGGGLRCLSLEWEANSSLASSLRPGAFATSHMSHYVMI